MSVFKRLVRQLLNPLGYDLRRYAATHGDDINVLQLAVQVRLSLTPSFFFVQIGANDGRMQDPLYHLITTYGLAGVLVEPIPDLFEELRANYSDQEQLRFENCAISDHDGTRELFRFRDAQSLHPAAAGIASFSRQELLRYKRHLPGSQDRIESLMVPTFSLTSLFERHEIDHLDLLQIDTEGYDWEIIQMMLKTPIRPCIVAYERINLDNRDQDACRRALDAAGYVFADTGLDTVALRRSMFDLTGKP